MFEGEPSPQENFDVRWIKPSIKNEMAEIERTSREIADDDDDYNDVLEKIIEALEQSELETLSETNWTNLENTDSFESIRVGHLEDVQKIIDESNSELPPERHRSIEEIIDALKKGEIDAPIILKRKTGNLYLISGNTRLSVARALGIKPEVLIADVEK
jgi:ABC-type dipeptide/oligopeptide/nickel transport system ATPase subunit